MRAGERNLLRKCLEYSSYSINDIYQSIQSSCCFVHQNKFKNHQNIASDKTHQNLAMFMLFYMSSRIIAIELQFYFIIVVSFLYTCDFICVQGDFRSRIRLQNFLKSKIVSNRKYCCSFRNRILYQVYFLSRKNRNFKNLLTSYFSFFFFSPALLGARGFCYILDIETLKCKHIFLSLNCLH